MSDGGYADGEGAYWGGAGHAPAKPDWEDAEDVADDEMGWTTPASTPSRRRGSPGAAGIAVLILLLALAGAADSALNTRFGPPSSVAAYCGAWQHQQYGTAYDELAPTAQRKYARVDFVASMRTLDAVEGPVRSCSLDSVLGGFSGLPWASPMSLPMVVTRQQRGRLTGTLTLASGHGTWRVSGFGTSLLGINLGALQVAQMYCDALQRKDYAAAYRLLSASARQQLPLAAFVADEKTHDTLDGAVRSCAIASLGTPNSDTTATLGLRLVRGTLSPKTGTVSLAVEKGAWRISGLDPSVRGTDLSPLDAGTAFCADLARHDLNGAYALTSQRYQEITSREDFGAAFDLGADYTFGTCHPDLAGYTVSSTSARYTMVFALVPADAWVTPASGTLTLSFVREGSAWKLDDYAVQS